MSRFRIFAASLALLAHTFAIGALCLCSAEAMPGMSAPRAELSCHETAAGLSWSTPDACCCDNNPAEGGTSSLVTKRTLDEISLQTLHLKAFSVPLVPTLRTAPPSATHSGVTAPRPPLRV